MTAQEKDGHLRIGVIGCGHWGPNHVRVFSELERSCVVACADPNPSRMASIARRYPAIRCEGDYRSILEDSEVDAVVVSTPTQTHAAIVADALRAGKHVLAEKPLTMTAEEGRSLKALAAQHKRLLMVGHVFLFNAGINKLREMIASGALGRLHYLDAVRTNLGPVRGDVNALYDLGTHDISIFNYLTGETPESVSATGSCISQKRLEDVCFATLRYPSGTVAHLHVSWLNPRKVRTLTAVGAHRMAHWDDVDPSDTLRVYDKGFDEPPSYNSFGEFQYMLRSGDVHLPAVSRSEPLANQARTFIAAVLDGVPIASGVDEGTAVVEVLEAANRSMANGGALCRIPISDLSLPRLLAVSEVGQVARIHTNRLSKV